MGDCDGDGAVIINALILGVDVALGNADLNACPAMQCSDSGCVFQLSAHGGEQRLARLPQRHAHSDTDAAMHEPAFP